MKFSSAGQLIDPRTVSYRSLGFGEAVALETTAYELEINYSQFPQSFLDCADTFIDECRTDDIVQGFIDVPELERLDYPHFRALLNNTPDLAARLIADYLYFELLFSLFPNSSALAVVINSIESVYAEGTSILITGKTYPARQL